MLDMPLFDFLILMPSVLSYSTFSFTSVYGSPCPGCFMRVHVGGVCYQLQMSLQCHCFSLLKPNSSFFLSPFLWTSKWLSILLILVSHTKILPTLFRQPENGKSCFMAIMLHPYGKAIGLKRIRLNQGGESSMKLLATVVQEQKQEVGRYDNDI